MGHCAGIDWASEKHDLLIESEAGEELLGAVFAHSEAGIAAMCAALVRHEVALVAIERPDGLLVDRILDAGIRVMALHPNQVAASRDRFRASGGKSDRFDRFVLCELARTDAHRFRVLEPDSDQTKALRALTRAREDLVAARVAMGNQLRAELERFWPESLTAHPDGPVFRSFFASSTSVLCPATLLAEIGDSRAHYLHRDAISAQAGSSPLADESGKRKGAQFAGHATTDRATRFTRSPTRSDAGTHGPPTSTPPPAHAGTTTAARSEPSVAAWPGSSGSARAPAPPMTPTSTPRRNATSP